MSKKIARRTSTSNPADTRNVEQEKRLLEAAVLTRSSLREVSHRAGQIDSHLDEARREAGALLHEARFDPDDEHLAHIFAELSIALEAIQRQMRAIRRVVTENDREPEAPPAEGAAS